MDTSDKYLGIITKYLSNVSMGSIFLTTRRSIRALTRWVYTNTHITVYYTYRLQYTATVFQLRFKVVPELSGKSNTSAKGLTQYKNAIWCPNFKTSRRFRLQVKLYLVR